MTVRRQSSLVERLILWSLPLCVLVFLVFVEYAEAAGPSQVANRYVRTRFADGDGLPNNLVENMVQSHDGFLWLRVTGIQLARFDGRQFEVIPGLGRVLSMDVAPNGDLWVGTTEDLKQIPASSLNQFGHLPVITFHPGQGLANNVSALHFARNGILWVGTALGLYRFEHGVFSLAISGTYIEEIAETPNGHLWVSTRSGPMEWDGSRADLHPELEKQLGVKTKDILNVLEDSHGVTWFCTAKGVARRVGGTIERLQPYGLHKHQALRVYEDPKGRIWISKVEGLFQGTDGGLELIAAGMDIRRMYADEAGDLWVGTNGNGLFRFKERAAHMFTTADGLPGNVAMAVLAAHDGALWAGFNCGGITRFDGHSFRVYNEKDGLLNSCVVTLAEDTKHDLWIGTYGGGTFRFHDGSFTQYTQPQGLPINGECLLAAQDGSVWVGGGNSIYHMRDGKVRRYTKADGLTSGYCLRINEDPEGGIWVTGLKGIDRLVGERFVKYAPQSNVASIVLGADRSDRLYFLSESDNRVFRLVNDQLVQTASGMDVEHLLETEQGDLWLTGVGIFRVPRGSFDCPPRQDEPVDFEQFGLPDGLATQSISGGYPPAALTADGKLWLATNQGLAMFDLPRLPGTVLKPAIYIKGVTVGRNQQPPGRALILPAGTHHLELNFDGIEISSPEKIRLQYRLDSVDSEWLDAKPPGRAIYSNIPPGKHAFHIRASNRSGIWDRDGMVYYVTQQPYFYQTPWFLAAAIAVGLLLIAGMYQLRMRAVARTLSARFEGQLAERTRIARELHDTLLQSFSALLVRLQSVSKILPARPEDAKQRVDGAIEQASNAIAEGRDAVHELRSEGCADDDLAQAIGNFGRELLSGTTDESRPEFRVHVGGTPRRLNPMVRDEAYRIAVEALRNAVRYAGAKQIEAEIQYDAQHLRLRIRDDGKGIDQEVLERGHTPGHWGLRGMRERARLLGGNFEIWSDVGSGAEVELTVPAASAYSKPASRWSVFLKGGWSIFWCAWLFVFATANRAAALALEPDHTIEQFIHTSWGAKEGAPVNIKAMAQTADGYLWFGAGDGLFRFDGTVFERYEPQAGPALPVGVVTALLGLPNGDLWIGYYFGAITLLRHGRAQNYTKREGVPDGHLWGFAQDRQGTIWAGTNAGLARFEGGRWQQVGKEWNFPWKWAKAVFVDHKGTLWVAADNTIAFLPEGARTFQSTSIQVGQALQFAEAANGKLWMAETSRSVRPIPLADTLSPSDETEVRVGARSILFDREGSLWIPTLGDGMRRVSAPEQLTGKPGRFDVPVQQYMKKDGLSDDTAVTILQDRDGNIWVGTMSGIDRFRRSGLVPAKFAFNNFNPVLVPGDNGDVWSFLSARTIHLDKSHADEMKGLMFPVDSAYRDSRGAMWVITGGNLVRFENGRFNLLPLPKELPIPATLSLKITEDRSGVLWLAAEEWGLYRRENGQWSRVETPPDVAKLLPTSAFTDEQGRVWFGYFRGVVVALDEGKLQILRLKETPSSNDVYAIQGRNKHLWVGTTSNLLFFDSSQFHAVAPADQPKFLDVTGIKELADGSLWLCEKRGIIHIDAAEVRRFLDMPSHRVHYEVFDSRDGVQGTFLHTGEKLVEATDHRLWFAASKGIVWLDPGIPRNLKPLSTLIKYVNANGQQFPLGSDLSLPPRIGNLQIGYAAVDLSVPERVHYRYKLDGMDKDWQDVGIRREAIYTNLSPGKYKFHMAARHEGEEWSTEEAILDLRIAPAWFQTIWFRGFCVCVFLFLLWTLYQLRLRQLERQFNTTLEARVTERTRIARELHDTLLQTFSASLLRFQSVSKMLPTCPEEAKQRADSAIEQASSAIAEGRDAVHELRSGGVAMADLAESINNFANELLSSSAGENSPEVRVQVEGTPRNLDPMARDEAYRIGAEALRNAVRYAGARRIEVEIRYDEQQLRLRIRDNGKGIEPEVLEQGRAPGRWGLHGMRERAKLLGGNFEVWSELGSGTEVELTVPAASAYPKPTSRWTTLLRRWRS